MRVRGRGGGKALGPFELSASFVNRGEMIRGDGYLEFCEASMDVTYRKRDFLFRRGVWRGAPQQPEFLAKRNEGGNRVLVVGHSDMHTARKHQLLLRAAGVTRMWGTNLTPMRGFSEAIPLGISNSEPASMGHVISGDLGAFVDAVGSSDICRDFAPHLYVNMTIRNNLVARRNLLRAIEFSDFRTSINEPSLSRQGLVSYLRKMRESPLTPCPEGNGVDTHRLWECLYVGGTPVVVKNRSMNRLYDQLPVIVLESWSDLRDTTLIETLWDKTRNKPWNKDLLSLSFWKHQILTSIQWTAI